MMIAHGFRGPVFGPAQALHGATFVVDVQVKRRILDADGLVVDIGALSRLLGEVLSLLNYRNLDEMPQFEGINTTSEWLAGYLHRQISARIRAGDLGASAMELAALKVTLHESHIAWAAFEGPLDEGEG